MAPWRALPIAAVGREQERPGLDREFQAAVAQYDAGHFAEAAAELENLVRDVPESFEVHELLGLVYSGESQDAQANQHLEKAVRLKPDSAAARTNLATNLVRLGKLDPAQEQLKKAVVARAAEALMPITTWVNSTSAWENFPTPCHFSSRRSDINPSSYDNGYDLSLAYL